MDFVLISFFKPDVGKTLKLENQKPSKRVNDSSRSMLEYTFPTLNHASIKN